MKAERAYPRFTITAKGTRWVEGGHPWIYAQEIVSAPEGVENGALVDAVSEKGKYLGSGFFSRESKIRIRLLSRNANDRFDADFWRRRIRYAWDYRKTVMGADVSCCRVIFGEADGFPGLTVDRFESLLVTQTLSVGMERIKEMLFPLLVEVLAEDGVVIDGVFERNDAAIRALEGMEQGKGWFPLEGRDVPASAVTEICENGVYYRVDVENGQKTGFFLDQKYNRLAVARLARGRRVLDCFTHTGSFALNAARGGAEHVTAVDISPEMVRIAREKFPQENVRFVCGDAETAPLGEGFDAIVIYNAFPHFPDPERLVARLAALLAPGGRLTVAHGSSRADIDAHHHGAASRVSNGLMEAEALAAIFARHLRVTEVISTDEMYQVVGEKE